MSWHFDRRAGAERRHHDPIRSRVHRLLGLPDPRTLWQRCRVALGLPAAAARITTLDELLHDLWTRDRAGADALLRRLVAAGVYENADVKAAFGSDTTITITLTSLSNGNARESTVIDNTSNKYLDALVRIKTNGQTSGTALLDWYAYLAISDTTYTDGATGTDAAFTAANRRNSSYLTSTQMNAGTGVIGPVVNVARACGGILPPKWGLLAINNSGAALSATGGDHEIKYAGVYATVI